VLIDGVVAAEKSGGADVETLLFGDFFWSDETRGVARARGGDCGIEGMCEGVAESDTRWSGLNEFARISALKHARLGGHGRESFYTLETVKSVICNSRLVTPAKRVAKKEDSLEGLPPECYETSDCDYFLAAADFAAASAYFLVKRSTRPAVSTSFCLPVKKGWQLEQISTRSISPLTVERVGKVFPQAQWTVTA